MRKISNDEAGVFDSLLGEEVVVICVRYIYHGTLKALDSDGLVLTKPSIVYETGSFEDKEFKDIQSLITDEFVISIGAVESIGKSMKKA